MHLRMEDASSIMPNGDPSSCHAQVTHTLFKWYEIGHFGKVRLRGRTIMLKTVPFGTCIMMNFEVEVWKFQHVEIFSNCQVTYSIIPPCLTSYVSSK